MCAAGVALAALLLLLTAAIVRLVVLLVQLVTPRYTLAACASALALWFVDSRRQRYAKGFYSCSRKVAAAPPSETESEDDDSEAGAPPSIKARARSPASRHSKSLANVRTRSNTTDGELQRRQATRPRSSSARKRRVPRRRADTGMNGTAKHQERSRRATFASKQDAYVRRSSSERLEDALRSDGYWIGDFRVQRRLVSRRSHTTSSPKAN
ncbi:hypothetical protein PHYSODRAFT_531430 [Phytophthora sojae]|uniref:Transmembrane protein n=1 Tax=Phytophthora sojae (strain P6497) TaxID=1094619 RepID=G5AEH6_PHYSP|nr:hypothetical protein PHYSODRAFT_531430 [Phytophthora sojae]EGZ06578.1 hypothetical protein PHYSODRAFT_531430 [Phytophthora sojae]|eukprot:XP_009538475.1 hypothetical protein PHYSODRAFT_531430 [Phytophthora sojae]